MAAKKQIFVSQKKSRDQNFENHFPQGIFQKIWLKVEKHEHIYIFEIQFERKNIQFKMVAKASVTLRNNVHLC